MTWIIRQKVPKLEQIRAGTATCCHPEAYKQPLNLQAATEHCRLLWGRQAVAGRFCAGTNRARRDAVIHSIMMSFRDLQGTVSMMPVLFRLAMSLQL